MLSRLSCLLTLVSVLSHSAVFAADAPPLTKTGDQIIADYFAVETAQLRDASLSEFRKIEDWDAQAGESRRQLLEMLGLEPLPERTDLQPVITGTVEHPEFIVEKLHFQSRPGLYVTGNLYRPKTVTQPLPAILYVCGHGRVVKEGVSLGNKTHYQHHAGWFARNGYVCLIIDTLQLGEIEGIHHGTYKEKCWWWLSRGYCPAGVEAWNCMRALDYLQSRPEVDGSKLGVTGRSGGGAYSWWISAIDDRIKVAVPVAGITDLENHVIDGCVSGHCDCMYMVNTYRWDYDHVAALNYPRPLLISNTDRDGIFPLNGVYRTYSKVRQLYELGKHPDDVALNITAGGHKDTQELQIHAMRWFDQHLKGEVRLIQNAAEKFFEPEQLKVFATLPTDELNTTIDQIFVPMTKAPEVPKSAGDWAESRDQWVTALKAKTFRGWPQEQSPLNLKLAATKEADGLTLQRFDFTSQAALPLSLYVLQRSDLKTPELTVLNPLDQAAWTEFHTAWAPKFPEVFAEGEEIAGTAASNQEVADVKQMLTSFPWAMAYVAPRGIGPTQWSQDEKTHTQILRRFYLLGQTWEGMQCYDICRALQALRETDQYRNSKLWLQARGPLAVLSLYAAIMETTVTRLDLYDLPASHMPDGPALLNVLKTLDIPQAIALAAEKSQVVIYRDSAEGLGYAFDTAKALNWPEKQLQLRKAPMPAAQ